MFNFILGFIVALAILMPSQAKEYFSKFVDTVNVVSTIVSTSVDKLNK